MISQADKIRQNIAKFPDTPGVYQFLVLRSLGEGGKREKKILYIGKATSLRDRVRSYFNKDIVETRSPLVSKMLTQFDDIEVIKTDSVLEALVLEAHLIKKYQPEANKKEKDNRSFNFVIITKEDFPRVLIARGRELLNNELHRVTLCKDTKKYIGLPYVVEYSFGPFPNGSQLKEAMKIIRKMFPFRDKCLPCVALAKEGGPNQTTASRKATQGIACFNRQIGLCPGVCTGEITKEQYTEQIKNIILFFEGNKKRLIKNLEKQMKIFSNSREYENANKIKKTIFTLNHIQDVALIKDNFVQGETLHGGFRIESYDIAHMSGQNVVGVMTVVEDGEIKKSDYRKFKIRSAVDGVNNNFSHGLGIVSEDLRKNIIGGRFINDTKALSEVLSRRLAHIEWKLPDLIVVDGGTAQKRVVEKVLKENLIQIPVVSVVKDERHRPKEILGDKKWLKYEREITLSNSEAHRYGIAFHKKLRDRI